MEPGVCIFKVLGLIHLLRVLKPKVDQLKNKEQPVLKCLHREIDTEVTVTRVVMANR